MDPSSVLSSKPSVIPETVEATSADRMSDDLRAIRALRLLLESRMIDHTEYERRLASFKRRQELGEEKLAGDADSLQS